MSTTHDELNAAVKSVVEEAFRAYAKTKAYNNTISLVFSDDRESVNQAIWSLFRAGYVSRMVDERK